MPDPAVEFVEAALPTMLMLAARRGEMAADFHLVQEEGVVSAMMDGREFMIEIRVLEVTGHDR